MDSFHQLSRWSSFMLAFMAEGWTAIWTDMWYMTAYVTIIYYNILYKCARCTWTLLYLRNLTHVCMYCICLYWSVGTCFFFQMILFYIPGINRGWGIPELVRELFGGRSPGTGAGDWRSSEGSFISAPWSRKVGCLIIDVKKAQCPGGDVGFFIV